VLYLGLMPVEFEWIAYDLRMHGNMPPLPHTTQRLDIYALRYRYLASCVHAETFERKDIFEKNQYKIIFFWHLC